MSHLGGTLALLALAGCASGSASTTDTDRTLVVFAASSLTDVLATLEAHHEAANPGLDVSVSTAGSQVLHLQILQGAPADVFLSADPAHIAELVDLGLLAAPRVVGHNRLALIVPSENPAAITSLAELPQAERLVLGSPDAPIGHHSRALIALAGAVLGPDYQAQVLDRVVSEESNSRLVRAKVALGEADAALVYRTDARGVDGVLAIDVPQAWNPPVDYVGAAAPDRPAAAEARAWLAFLGSESGRRILADHGFGPAE